VAQLELFAQPAASVATAPTVESARARLEAVLTALRSGSAASWTSREAARWKVVVPQMADWLPAAEGDVVRAEFAALIERF
jgi:hypothetical protein